MLKRKQPFPSCLAHLEGTSEEEKPWPPAHGALHRWTRLLGAAAAAAKSLQSCPTLCDLMDCSPSFTISCNLFKSMSIESVMPSNHLTITPGRCRKGCLGPTPALCMGTRM